MTPTQAKIEAFEEARRMVQKSARETGSWHVAVTALDREIDRLRELDRPPPTHNDAILERMWGLPAKTATTLEALSDPSNPNVMSQNDNCKPQATPNKPRDDYRDFSGFGT